MNVSQSIAALTTALVHPTGLRSSFEHERHQTFLLRTLVGVFIALAAAPLFLAFHGAPSSSAIILFSLCLAPLGAVMVVSKTGRLVIGHAIYIACLVAIGTVLAVTSQAGLVASLAWLIAAQSESLVSLDDRLIKRTAFLNAFVFIGLALFSQLDPRAPMQGGSSEMLFTGFALGLALVNALSVATSRRGEQKAFERQLSQLKAITATIDDITVGYDADGTVDFVAPGCEHQLGLGAADLAGRGLFEHIHVGDRPIFLKAIADAAHSNETITASFRLRVFASVVAEGGGAEMRFLWIEMRARRLEKTGARPGVISLLRNVTEAKEMASDLDSARQSVAMASQSRDQFLANMSHELRTPLNAIIGFSEMLENPDLRPKESDKQTEYARIINQSGQHLLAVVNSILDMSKIQSGTFAITPESFDVASLIQSCCEIVTLKAQEGQVEILRQIRTGLDPVIGDRRACKQILINLLSNAVKFTPRNGAVTISARPEGTSLVIGVSDNGIGIGAADLARLGDPFFQVKSSLDRPYEGTGLGLSVVRGLVGLHGGSIMVESEPGHGTSVFVRLPLDCRFVTPTTSAKIETFAQRRAVPSAYSPSQDSMVKKIA